MSGKTTTERREHFYRLVEEAEASFAEDPAAYRRKLGFLAGLGYAYIFGILLLTLILIGLCILGAIKSQVFLLLLIKKKLGIVLIVVFYILMKALWVKLDAPIGYRLKRRDFPTLFEEVDAIRKQVDAPKIHEILLITDFNAAIAQTPRLGIFGWHKNTLILGLSLMMILNKEQFLSVIAHEFGHLSGNHSRFAGWIYRVRMTWMRIMEAFDQAGGWAHVIFGKFFDWYAPYFNAYSFALARANEYEADAVAAAITSNAAVVGALAQVHVTPQLVDKYYWTGLEKRVGKSAEVERKIYSNLMNYLGRLPATAGEAGTLLDKAMGEQTGHDDTHPALRDRIAPYAEQVSLPELPDENAAQALLGANLTDVLDEFDHDWAESNAESWKERHEYVDKARQERRALVTKLQEQALTDEELWNLAAWTEELEPDLDPLPFYHDYLERNPDDAGANYAIGRILLDRQDADGLPYLDKSMSDFRAVLPACELAYAFCTERDDAERAEAYRLKGEQHIDLQNKAQAERANLYDKDRFAASELSDEWITHLTEQLASIAGIKEAWIYRKVVEIFPEEPVYVIIYTSAWGKSHDKLNQTIIDTLEMPADYFVINRKGDHKKLAKRALTVARKLL